jgi:hypothetical protein
MTPPPTRFFVELHFPEPIDDDGHVDLEDMPIFAPRSLEGNSIGTTRVIGVEFPEPNIIRFELGVGDLVFAGIDYGDEHEEFE